MPSCLSISQISKSFGKTGVLRDIALDVREGEFVSLVGASGCGKSTLLRIIAGLEQQDGGTVTIGNRIVDGLSPRDRNIAMVFQSYALYPHMTAFDNVALPLRASRLGLAERLPLIRHLSPRRRGIEAGIAADVGRVAEVLRISHLLSRKPGQLSGGQRQRIALARAMVRDPSVFLMDEPLSNLDAQLRVHMRGELTELQRRLGATVIYVTHDQIEAMTMSDRIAIMDGGRLVQFGTPDELYSRPAALSVATFIGSPAMNTFAAEISPAGTLVIGGISVPLALALPAGTRVTVGIRPEHLHIAGQMPGLRLPAEVKRSELHGADTIVFLALADATPLTLRLASSDPAAALARPGRSLALSFAPSAVHVFGADGMRVDPPCREDLEAAQ